MKTILITGSSRGIGRAIALRLAEPNTKFYLHGRDSVALDECCRVVEDAGAQASPIISELGSDSGVTRIAEAVDTDRLDVLIHNAGFAYVAGVDELKREDWERSLAVNLTAPVFLTTRLLPKMSAGSNIVHILSVAANSGFPGWSAYSAAKFALRGFAQSLREELRERRIRVIDIYPAATASEIWKTVPGQWDKTAMMPPEETAEAVAFALSRPSSVLVDTVHIGGIGGNL